MPKIIIPVRRLIRNALLLFLGCASVSSSFRADQNSIKHDLGQTMLGAGWQSNLDVTAVEAQLPHASIFDYISERLITQVDIAPTQAPALAQQDPAGCGPQWLGRCSGNQPTPKSNPDSKNGALATPSSNANEAQTLTLIVAALRKGFDIENEACRDNNIAANECDAAFRKIIKYERVKLNPKGEEGVVVELQGLGFCGSRGCSGYLLRRTTNGYDNEGYASLGALEISGATTNGYYDLLFHGNKRYNAPDTVYTWDGSRYVEHFQNADGSAYHVPVAATPTEQAANQKQWDLYTEDLMADQVIGLTAEQYQKKNPHSCVTLQGLTPMSSGPYSSCDNGAYTFVFENGHFAFWVSGFKDNDINAILKSIEGRRGKPSAISPDRWSWGSLNAKNGPLLVTITPQSYWQFDGNRAAIDRFLEYKAMQAKRQEQSVEMQAKEQQVEYQGIVLGQYLTTHNGISPVPLKTDCICKDDVEVEAAHSQFVPDPNCPVGYRCDINANGGQSMAEHLDGKNLPTPLTDIFDKEIREYRAGQRESYCWWTTNLGLNWNQQAGRFIPKDRVRMIVVETRQTPQDVIKDMTRQHGPYRTVLAPATTMWQWDGPNVATRRILVEAKEAQDPQTLERFVTTEIIFQLLAGTSAK